LEAAPRLAARQGRQIKPKSAPTGNRNCTPPQRASAALTGFNVTRLRQVPPQLTEAALFITNGQAVQVTADP
jgi:hypothetical protein